MTDKKTKSEIEAIVKERMKDFTGYEGFWKPWDKEKMFPEDYEVEYAIQYVRKETAANNIED